MSISRFCEGFTRHHLNPSHLENCEVTSQCTRSRPAKRLQPQEQGFYAGRIATGCIQCDQRPRYVHEIHGHSLPSISSTCDDDHNYQLSSNGRGMSQDNGRGSCEQPSTQSEDMVPQMSATSQGTSTVKAPQQLPFLSEESDAESDTSATSVATRTSVQSWRSEDSDILHVAADSLLAGRSREDRDLDCVWNIAAQLRPQGTEPPLPTDARQSVSADDALCHGVLWPKQHCAFKGCTWIGSDEHALANLRLRLMSTTR